MPTNFGSDLPVCPAQSSLCYQDFVDTAPIGLLGNDASGNCVYVNQQACELLGMTFQEAMGLGWSDRLHPEDRERVLASWVRAFDRRESWQAEYRLLHRDRTVVWVLVRCVFTFNERGESTGSIGSLTDITAQKDLEATLGQMNRDLQGVVHLDGLTGIPNRRYFDEHLPKEWMRLADCGLPLSLMMLDIDYFKPYNDTYGHVFGDKVLKVVAQTADRVVKASKSSVIARYGGEEFAAILPETFPGAALQTATAIAAAVRDLQIHHQGSQVSDYLTLSVGLTTLVPTSEQTPEGALHEADIALYLAKKGGRDRVVVYSDEIAMGE